MHLSGPLRFSMTQMIAAFGIPELIETANFGTTIPIRIGKLRDTTKIVVLDINFLIPDIVSLEMQIK